MLPGINPNYGWCLALFLTKAFTNFHDRMNLLNSFLDVFLCNGLNQRGAKTKKNERIRTI